MAFDISNEREFTFTRKDFNDLVTLVRNHTGIALADTKFNMAYGRIVRRLRPLGLSDCQTYLDHISKPENGAELVNFVNAMTTNLTSFFRESHHFDMLHQRASEVWLPEFKAGTRAKARIWSAGCSSGEEPYSMSLTLQDLFAKHPSYDTLILATDIDTNMLDKGRRGVYSAEGYNSIQRGKTHFKRLGSEYEASQAIRNRIRFKRLNLMHKWPFQGKFDAIFCRNVLIYFEPETRRAVTQRFVDQLVPGGLLCLGHSESLVVEGMGLKSLGKSAFEKPDPKSARATS